MQDIPRVLFGDGSDYAASRNLLVPHRVPAPGLFIPLVISFCYLEGTGSKIVVLVMSDQVVVVVVRLCLYVLVLLHVLLVYVSCKIRR